MIEIKRKKVGWISDSASTISHQFGGCATLIHPTILPLDKVHPLHEVVKIDYFIPGCPPSGDAIWKFLTGLITGKTPELGHGLIKYD